MARPIVRNIQFSGLEVNFSGPPGGFVWTVQVTVPKAQPYQSYLILLDGVQVSSMQGTAVYGPIQLYQGNTLTIVNNAGGVNAGQSGIMYGQVDQEGHEPSGVFPAVSGGTVQTTGLNQIIWQGTWDSATTYQVNDLVEYQGSSYIAIAVNSDTVPTNTSFWNLVAEEGAAGPTGPTGPAGPVGMNWTGPWSSSTAYAVGDGVYQKGSSYICIVANTNQPPPDTGYWNELAAQATGVDATSIQGVAVSATAPTTGQVIEYNGTEYAPAAATTLKTQSLLLGADVPLAINTDTLILTDSFAAGTWLITFFGYILNPAPASFQASLRMTTGTAAATFDNTGEAAAGVSFTDTVPSAYLTRSSVVIVSSAGSLIMKAYANYTSQVNANDPVTSYPVTGYTALQIA